MAAWTTKISYPKYQNIGKYKTTSTAQSKQIKKGKNKKGKKNL